MQKSKSENPTYQAGIHPLGGLEPLHRYKLDSIIILHFAAATLPLHSRYMINMIGVQIHNAFCDNGLFID
jgi:hypothetical protein